MLKNLSRSKIQTQNNIPLFQLKYGLGSEGNRKVGDAVTRGPSSEEVLREI